MKAPRKTALRWASASLILISPLAWPADLTIPNTFVPGTPATAADVNANFSATATAVNSKQDRVIGTCPPGQSMQAVNQNGSVVCQPLSFFGGDGSAGNITISASQNWSSSPPANPNFANVTINAGQTLTVPAGTTIRCSGTFTNNGTLQVLFGPENDGSTFLTGVAPSSGVYTSPHPGDTPGAATMGQFDNNAVAVPVTIPGGQGGKAIPRFVAMSSFGNFRFGGGSGAGYDGQQGGRGGGLVKIYCEGAIANSGTISAPGENAANGSLAGGGGGIVILASRTSVSNAGTINVVGGNGNPATSFGGNGGGGGGGIIIMVSPTAPVPGTWIVTGGSGASGATTVSTTTRTAGAGGGSSGGAGGAGGQVSSAGVPSASGNGADGYGIAMTLDPIANAR